MLLLLLFIHSFGHFYSAPSSPLLLRGAPDYSTDTVSEFHVIIILLLLLLLLLFIHSFIHSFIHCRHLYNASSSGATQKRSQPQRGRIKLLKEFLGEYS